MICEYIMCRLTATYDVRFDGREHALCDEHIKPPYHPPDLHKKLPGAIKRAVRRIVAGA